MPRCSSGVELRQILRFSLGKRAIDLETRIGPAANPLAVVQVRPFARAVPCVRLVIAASGTQWTRPAGRAVSLVRDVMLRQKIFLLRAIDSAGHRADLMLV